MHPTLQLTALSALPFSTRRTALAAARGSSQHLHDIEIILEDNRGNPKMLAYLPVFYANLNPVHVPNGDDFDDFLTAQLMLRALISLRAVYHLAACIPLAYRGEFHDHGITCLDFLIFVWRFRDSRDAAHLMYSTEGFRLMLARTWTVLIRKQHPLLPVEYPEMSTNTGLDALADMLFSSIAVASPEHAEEIVEGAGGRLLDLANLIIAFLCRCGLSCDDTHGSGSRLGTEVFEFVDSMDKTLLPVDKTLDGFELGPLGLVLASANGLASLVMIIEALTARAWTNIPFPHLVTGCLALLGRVLMSDPGQRAMRESIGTVMRGLLYATVMCLSVNQLQQPLAFLLDEVLPQFLLQYYAMPSIDQAIQEAESIGDPSKSSSRFSVWNRFTALASARLKIYDFTNVACRLKACDNIDCGRFDGRANFQRCSCCLSFYYCSASCQKLDWNAGEHRKYCRPDRSIRLSASSEFSIRERYFLADVLHHDFHAKRDTIDPQQAAFTTCNPDTSFFTLFDYTTDSGPVDIRVEAPDRGAKYFETSDLGQWADHVSRAARSRGRMELLVMAVPVGSKTRYFVIPHMRVCIETDLMPLD
ncbi:hypothetical protein B0H16DRAFT_1899206 [Mycena metata]|uniref:MYND-type domain-containing protein n=1 Tax=Mycena metata TaxID=1033252 RepID=A0AAD7MFH5_9AGAR|nr:hypothetical protein B0H16DRAFT_1899206 [Mycena metata]